MITTRLVQRGQSLQTLCDFSFLISSISVPCMVLFDPQNLRSPNESICAADALVRRSEVLVLDHASHTHRVGTGDGGCSATILLELELETRIYLLDENLDRPRRCRRLRSAYNGMERSESSFANSGVMSRFRAGEMSCWFLHEFYSTRQRRSPENRGACHPQPHQQTSLLPQQRTQRGGRARTSCLARGIHTATL